VVVNLNDLREFDMELARCVLAMWGGWAGAWAGEYWSLCFLGLGGLDS
jgi:hypothetical protein